MKRKVEVPRVSVVFDRRKECAKRGDGAVDVLVYYDRTRTYIRTGVRVCANQWSDDYMVVGRKDAKELNALIQEQVEKCRDEVLRGLYSSASGPKLTKMKVPSAKTMRVDRSEASFLDWMRGQIDSCRLEPATVKHHNTVYESLQSFGKIRRWEDVTPVNITEWLKYVGRRDITQVTLYGYWKRLKKWIGVAQDLHLLPMDAMAGVRCERGKSKKREFLTEAELRIWQKGKVKNMCLERVRELFLVQCGTGLAFEDMMLADFGRVTKMGKFYTLVGVRKKSKEQYFIVILPFAYDVLKKWNFELPTISNQKYNKYLGEVAEVLGIDKHVTSHIGRHTYACKCLRDGVRIEAVSRALGHSDIKTTQIYARLQDTDVLDAFEKMK